jgi:hypothetical protein
MIEFVRTAVELVRKRRDMYFEGGIPTMEGLISSVTQDVSGIGNVSAKVVRSGAFAGISADVDWMRTERASFHELFERFVIPTPMTPNSHRAEILLVAVCGGLLTEGEIGDLSMGLTWADVPDAVKVETRPARILVWRFDRFDRSVDINP